MRISGRDIRSYGLTQLREKFGVVFQNDVIFKDSILENVRLRRDLTPEAVDKALKTAQAEEFVRGKSGELEEELNIRGANLSGGPETAPAHRPGTGRSAGNSDPGRLLQRTGLPHGRQAAGCPGPAVSGNHQGDRGPAGQLHPPCGPHPGAAERKGRRTGKSRAAFGGLRGIPQVVRSQMGA